MDYNNMSLEEFLQVAEEQGILGKLTIAERIKFATAFQWSWGEKPTPEEAAEKARKECTKESIEKGHEEGNLDFESELASIKAIKRIAGLTEEETKQLDEEIFTKGTVSGELAGKIKSAFEGKGVEACVIEALGLIHGNWMRNHPSNFQKTTRNEDGTVNKRDKDYQFVDSRLMSFDKDGAAADLIFLKPILNACGITIDLDKLKQEFLREQQEFLRENGIVTKEDLRDYIARGSEVNPDLEGLVAGDGSDRTVDEILQTEPEVVDHMTEQVISRSGIILPSEKDKKINEEKPNGDGDKYIYNKDDFKEFADKGKDKDIINKIEKDLIPEDEKNKKEPFAD